MKIQPEREREMEMERERERERERSSRLGWMYNLDNHILLVYFVLGQLFQLRVPVPD